MSFQFRVPKTKTQFSGSYVESNKLSIDYTNGALTFLSDADISSGDYLYSGNGVTLLGKVAAVESSTITLENALADGTSEVLVVKQDVEEKPIVAYSGSSLSTVSDVFNAIKSGQSGGASLVRQIKTNNGSEFLEDGPMMENITTEAEFLTHFRVEIVDASAGFVYHARTLQKHDPKDSAMNYFQFDVEDHVNIFIAIPATRLAKKFQDHYIQNVQTITQNGDSAFVSTVDAFRTFRIYEVQSDFTLNDLTNSNANMTMENKTTNADRKDYIQSYFTKLLGNAAYASANDIAVGDYIQHNMEQVLLNVAITSDQSVGFGAAAANTGKDANYTIEGGRLKLTAQTGYDAGKIIVKSIQESSNFFPADPSAVTTNTTSDTMTFTRGGVSPVDLNFGYFVLDANKSKANIFTSEINAVVKPNGLPGSGDTSLSILHAAGMTTYVNQTANSENTSYQSAKGSESALTTELKSGSTSYGTIAVDYVDANAVDSNAGKLKVTVTVNKNLDQLSENDIFYFTIQANYKDSIYQYVSFQLQRFNQSWSMASSQDVANRNSWRVLTDKDHNNSVRKAVASFGISAPLWNEDADKLFCAPRALSDVMSLFCDWSYDESDVLGDGSKGYYASLNFANAADMYDKYRLKKDDVISGLRGMAAVGSENNDFSVDIMVDFTLDNVTGGFTKKDGSHFLQYGDSQLQDLMGDINETNPENIRAYKLRVKINGDAIQLMIRTDQTAQEALQYTWNVDHKTPFGTDDINGIDTNNPRYRTHFMSVANLVGKDLQDTTPSARVASMGAFEMVPSTHANAEALELSEGNRAEALHYRYIKITSDLTVSDLTLQPGTLVEFQGDYRLTVSSALTAEGTKGNPIIFRGIGDTADEAFGDNTPVARWKGLTVGANSTKRFCTIIGGGSDAASLNVGDATGLTMDHVTIMNSQLPLSSTTAAPVSFLRLMNNASTPSVTGTVYTYVDGQFSNGTGSNEQQAHPNDDAFDSNYYMSDYNRVDLTLEWKNDATSYAEDSMGIFMFYRQPADNLLRKEYIRIARADSDIGMYAYAVNLMDPNEVVVTPDAALVYKRSISTSTTKTIGTYSNNGTPFPTLNSNPSGLFMSLSSNDGTGVLTSDGSSITLKRNSSDEVPTTITVNVRNGNGQLYAVDANDGVSHSIALSYKEDVEAEMVRQEPISNPFKEVVSGGIYTTPRNFEGKTQVVIDGSVILGDGASWTFGPNTDIVMMEKPSDNENPVFDVDASALVVTASAQLTFGDDNIIRGHLDRLGNRTASSSTVAGLFCGTGSTTYIFNRTSYNNLGSTANPNVTLNNVRCLVPQVGASDGAVLNKHITDGIRVPSSVTTMTVTDVALIEQSTIIPTLRMEPGSTLKFHPWVLDDASTSATVAVATALDCVGDAANCVTIDGVNLEVTGTVDLRYATSNKFIDVDNASSNIRQLRITAADNDFAFAQNMGLILQENINSDVRDIVLDGCGIQCNSSDCILQNIDILNMPSGVSPLQVDGTPTIRNIHYTSAGDAAELVEEIGTVTTALAAGNYLTSLEEGLETVALAKENDIVAYTNDGNGFNPQFYLYYHANNKDLAATHTAWTNAGNDAMDADAQASAINLGLNGWFIHAGSRLDKDIQQFGSVSGDQSTETAFGYAIVGGKTYACETSLTETVDKNADRTLVLTTSNMQATFTLTNAGACTSTSTKLKLQNMSPASATTSTNSILLGNRNRALLTVNPVRSTKLIQKGDGPSTLATQTGTDAAPVIVQSELGKLDRGRYSLTSVASDNAYVAIYGANTASNKLGNLGSNIALIDLVGDAITPEDGASTFTNYYIENCTGDAIAAGAGAGALAFAGLEIVNAEGRMCDSNRVESTSAYLETSRRVVQALEGTFTTPQVPHQYFFRPSGASSVSSRLSQWWHPRAKVAQAIVSHTAIPDGKVAEIRIFGGNDEVATIAKHASANNCEVSNQTLTYDAGLGDNIVRAQFTVSTPIAGTITVGSQDIYQTKTSLPTINAGNADVTKKTKRLTDQTAMGDVVAFASSGLDVAGDWTKYIFVQGTGGSSTLKEALLPPWSNTLDSTNSDNKFEFTSDPTLQQTLEAGTDYERTGVVVQTYALDRVDYAISNNAFVQHNVGFYAPKASTISAKSDNDLDIVVHRIPVIDIVDKLGVDTSYKNTHRVFAGAPATGANGYVAQIKIQFTQDGGSAITADNLKHLVGTKLTLGASSTVAADAVVVQGEVKGTVAVGVTGSVVDVIYDDDSNGEFQQGAATIGGNSVTISSTSNDTQAFIRATNDIRPVNPGASIAAADESSEVMQFTVALNADYNSETSSTSYSTPQAFMNAQAMNSAMGPASITLSLVDNCSLNIGSNDAISNQLNHTICQTAIYRLPSTFNQIDFFTSNVRRHRQHTTSVPTFTFGSTDKDDNAGQPLAAFIGTYEKTTHADLTNQVDSSNVGFIKTNTSASEYAGKGHLATVVSANAGNNFAKVDGNLESGTTTTLSGVVMVQGDVIFQNNVQVSEKCQLLFKSGARVRIAAGKTFTCNGGDDTTAPIIARHIDDHGLKGGNAGDFVGIDISDGTSCSITNMLMVGGQNQLVLPANASVSTTRLYNAATCALTLTGDAISTNVHIRNAYNAIKVDAGTVSFTDVLVENTLNKVLDHRSTATPSCTRCHFDCLSDTITDSDDMFAFGSSTVTATDCQLVQTTDKHLPRNASVTLTDALNATLGGKMAVAIGAFANSQNSTIFDATKTTLEYLSDEMSNGLARQVAKNYLPEAGLEQKMSVEYSENYDTFYNNALQLTTNAMTDTTRNFTISTKHYGANLAFSAAKTTMAKSSIAVATGNTSTTCMLFEALVSNLSAPYLHTFADVTFYNNLAVGDAVTIAYAGNSYSGEIKSIGSNVAILKSAIAGFPTGNADTNVTISKATGTALPTVATHADYTLNSTLIVAPLYGKRVKESDNSGDLETIPPGQFLSAAINVGTGAVTVTNASDDYTQCMRLVAKATPVVTDAQKETASDAYYTASVFASYGQRPEFRFYNKGNGVGGTYSTGSTQSWLFSNKQILTYAQNYPSEVSLADNVTVDGKDVDVMDAILATNQLIVESHTDNVTDADANLSAVADYNLLLSGPTPEVTIDEDDFKSNVQDATVTIAASPTYYFQNTIDTALYDSHAFGIDTIRVKRDNPAVLSANSSINFTMQASDSNGHFTVSRKALVGTDSNGAVTDIDTSYAMPTGVVTTGIFASDDLKQADNATYVSPVSVVESAQLPDVQPVEADTAGVKPAFDRAREVTVQNNSGVNSGFEISKLRIQPSMGNATFSGSSVTANSDFTLFDANAYGVNIVQSGDATSEFYALTTNNFAQSNLSRIELTKRVVFPSNSGNTTYTLRQKNLPKLKLADEPTTTAIVTTLNQKGVKLGVVDELEHALLHQTATIGNFGGIAVIQNMGIQGFDGEHAEAPQLFQIDDEQDVTSNTNLYKKRSGQLQYVSDVTEFPKRMIMKVVQGSSLTVSDSSLVQVGDVFEQASGAGYLSDTVRLKEDTLIHFTNGTKFNTATSINVYRQQRLIQTFASGNISNPVQHVYSGSGSSIHALKNDALVLLFNETNRSSNGYAKVISSTSTGEYTLELQGEGVAPADFDVDNTQFHYSSGGSGTNFNALGVKESIDFVSPHSSNAFKTELPDGTTTKCNNLVVMGLNTLKNNTQHNYKYIVWMQLNKNSQTKHSVAMLRSLVPHAESPSPLIVDTGGSGAIYREGMVANVKGRAIADVHYIDPSNQTQDLQFAEAPSFLGLGDLVNYGQHTATITVVSGLPSAVAADANVTQGGNLIGTIVSGKSATSTSFQINITKYDIDDDAPLVIGALTLPAADWEDSFEFTGASGIVSGIHDTSHRVTLSSVQGHFDVHDSKTLFVVNVNDAVAQGTNGWIGYDTSFTKVSTTQLLDKDDIINDSCQAISINSSGTAKHELGNFDASTVQWLSGIIVRKPADGRTSVEDQLFLEDRTLALLHKKLTVTRTNAATVSVNNSNKTITLSNAFAAGDKIHVKENGASIGGELTFGNDSASEAATKLAAHLDAVNGYSASANGAVVTLNKSSIFSGAVTAEVILLPNYYNSSVPRLTVSDHTIVPEVLDNGETQTITINGTDADYQGQDVEIVMDIAGTEVTTSITSTGANHPTKADIALAIKNATPNSFAISASGAVVTLTVDRGTNGTVNFVSMSGGTNSASQVTLSEVDTELGSAGNPNSSYTNGYDIMDVPASIDRTQVMDSVIENLVVGDQIKITSTLDDNTTTKTVTLTEENKNQYYTSDSWGIYVLAAELRKMGQYAHNSAGQMIISYARASDNVTLELVDGNVELLEVVAGNNNAHTYTIQGKSIPVVNGGVRQPATDAAPEQPFYRIDLTDKVGPFEAMVDGSYKTGDDAASLASAINSITDVTATNNDGIIEVYKAQPATLEQLTFTFTSNANSYGAAYNLEINGGSTSIFNTFDDFPQSPAVFAEAYKNKLVREYGNTHLSNFDVTVDGADITFKKLTPGSFWLQADENPNLRSISTLTGNDEDGPITYSSPTDTDTVNGYTRSSETVASTTLALPEVRYQVPVNGRSYKLNVSPSLAIDHASGTLAAAINNASAISGFNQVTDASTTYGVTTFTMQKSDSSAFPTGATLQQFFSMATSTTADIDRPEQIITVDGSSNDTVIQVRYVDNSTVTLEQNMDNGPLASRFDFDINYFTVTTDDHLMQTFEILVTKDSTKVANLKQLVGTKEVVFDASILRRVMTFGGFGSENETLDMSIQTDQQVKQIATISIGSNLATADNLDALVANIGTNLESLELDSTSFSVDTNSITVMAATKSIVTIMTQSGLQTAPSVAITEANIPASAATQTINFEGVPQIGDNYSLLHNYALSATATDNSLTSLLTKFKAGLESHFSNITVSGNQMIFTANEGDTLPANPSIRQNSRAALPASTVQATATSTVTINNAASLVKGNTITINDGTSDYTITHFTDQDETVDTELTRLATKVNAVYTATYESATKTITITAADSVTFTATMGNDATIN